MKILLAIDDSRYSEDAAKEVAERSWPPNTTVRVLAKFVPSAAELWYEAGGSFEWARENVDWVAWRNAWSITRLVRWRSHTEITGNEKIMPNKKRVLIICTGNSARSQMAEGILRNDAGDRFEVFSAGVNPTQVRPEAVEAMREIGIDISGQTSKSVDQFVGQDFDHVITVCDNARETCPVFPGKTVRIHQGFEDPPPPSSAVDADSMIAIFRRVRDEIRQWMKRFVSEHSA